MKLACADDTFRLLRPHRAVLELVAALGVEGVDVFLAGNRSIVRPEDVRGDIAGAAAAIRADVAAVGLAVSDVFVLPWTDLETMAPNHPDADERERSRSLFRDMLELAVAARLTRADDPARHRVAGRIRAPSSAQSKSSVGAPRKPIAKASGSRSSPTSARSFRHRTSRAVSRRRRPASK